MTLREYYAGQASRVSLLSSQASVFSQTSTDDVPRLSIKRIAQLAWIVADVLLEEEQ